MPIKCKTCNSDLNQGSYIKNECCKSFLIDNYSKIFQKEKRDIIKKALPAHFSIIDPLFEDCLGSHIYARDNIKNIPYLLVDINALLLEDINLCSMLLTDFLHFLTLLDESFLKYKEYFISESHVILVFYLPDQFRCLNTHSSSKNITLINMILSKGLRAVSQLSITLPDQFIAFEILNPKRMFLCKNDSIAFLFPIFHENFLKFSQYDDISYQLNVFERIIELKPSYMKNRINLMEIFNTGWNLYYLITDKIPEFDISLETKESWPLRPSKINPECTDYLEEIILRALFYHDSIPFSSINEIYTFLSDIYNHRMKVRQSSENSNALMALAKYYENVSLFSSKKNRWMGLAYDIYQQLSNKYPANTEYIYQKANIMFKTKKYEYAKSLIKKILAGEHDNIQAYLLLGYIYLEGYDDTDKSMWCYEKVNSLLSKLPVAVMMLKGDILIRKGELRDARDIFLQIFNSQDINPSIRQRARARLAKITG